MPDVMQYDDKKKWMKVCVPKMVGEGKDPKQGVAICFNMWRNKKETDVEEREEFMNACLPVLMEHGHDHQEAMMMCDMMFNKYAGYDEEEDMMEEDMMKYNWSLE